METNQRKALHVCVCVCVRGVGWVCVCVCVRGVGWVCVCVCVWGGVSTCTERSRPFDTIISLSPSRVARILVTAEWVWAGMRQDSGPHRRESADTAITAHGTPPRLAHSEPASPWQLWTRSCTHCTCLGCQSVDKRIQIRQRHSIMKGLNILPIL